MKKQVKKTEKKKNHKKLTASDLKKIKGGAVRKDDEGGSGATGATKTTESEYSRHTQYE